MDNTKPDLSNVLKEKEASSGLTFDQPKTDGPTDLGKAENYIANNKGTSAIPGGDIGWKPLPIENLPSAGIFYPDGATMEIRAAGVAEIRHFSTLDENDPLDMDDKLNVVMEKCLRIKFPERHASFKDLKEEDRFYIIFAVRELTFKNGENKLFANIKCGATCLGDGTYAEQIELSKDNFDWYKIDPKLMRLYDAKEKCFIINSPKAGNFKLYVPSIGVTTFIKNYLRSKVQGREFFDKAFIKVAPFVFQDWRGLNEAVYEKAQQDSFAWNPDRLAAILKLVEMIRFGVKTEIKKQCNKCGAEVAAPLTFPGGGKSLFLNSGTLEELLG